TYVGPDAVRVHVFDALARDFDGYRFDLDELVDAGDVQVGIGTYSGTFRETGRPFTARVAHIWRLASDRVVSFEQIVD
ncbi:nuclear transport factor 2 family protein, partial [Salmonella enterica subsp. enterica serovar Oranienburg]|nr:nuclear transport factor 2 family protein [Salmonella enterica subsp. enterica serovar Oranienburg]